MTFLLVAVSFCLIDKIPQLEKILSRYMFPTIL